MDEPMTRWLPLLLLLLLARAALADPGLALAVELDRGGEPGPAAVEYRRLALAAPLPESRAVFYWLAGRSYLLQQDPDRASAMLDRMDEQGLALKPLNSLLRAEVSRSRRDWDEAEFYLGSALPGLPDDETRRFATLRLAEVQVRSGQFDTARATVSGLADATAPLAALGTYAAGQDKNPTLGAWLGTVPGLGYAYSGRYATALRSLILNGLFIWGMAETAGNDQWGGFAVLTFFELTWYTGSIYGGRDSAEKYNRQRLDPVLDVLGRRAEMEPDYPALPKLGVRIRF
jgi:Tetratricopeptide repeat-like domain